MNNTEPEGYWDDMVAQIDKIMCDWEVDHSEDANEKAVRAVWEVVACLPYHVRVKVIEDWL